MKKVKHISAVFISCLLGLVFIYSGYSKLLPIIETFEFTFVDIGIANWYGAPIIARLFIGLEFFIGVLLVLIFNLRKFTLPFTVFLLLLFSTYLVMQVFINGDDGNCGCFGEHFKMTPIQAILKNLIMLAAIVFVYILSTGWKSRFNALLIIFTSLISITIPFVVNPVDFTYTSNNLEEKINYPLELDLLYSPSDTSKVEIPKVELRKGKHIVAFLSLTCSHCRIAAKKFRLIKKKNAQIPIYFVLNGERSHYKGFMKDTQADNIPSSFCLGKSFIQLSSSRLPRIYFIDEGLVVKKADYFELNQYAIEDWLSDKKSN